MDTEPPTGELIELSSGHENAEYVVASEEEGAGNSSILQQGNPSEELEYSFSAPDEDTDTSQEELKKRQETTRRMEEWKKKETPIWTQIQDEAKKTIEESASNSTDKAALLTLKVKNILQEQGLLRTWQDKRREEDTIRWIKWTTKLEEDVLNKEELLRAQDLEVKARKKEAARLAKHLEEVQREKSEMEVEKMKMELKVSKLTGSKDKNADKGPSKKEEAGK